MTNPAVQVTVSTEVGYCPFCRRSRTLRREERHLGGLVRTNIDCESCHRTLSSTMGAPQPKAEEAVATVDAEPAAPAEAEAEAAPKPAPKRRPAAKAAARKSAPRKTAATKKTRS
jgi:hypothetical protein